MPIIYESYATSTQKVASAQKRPVNIGIYLYDETWTTNVENMSLFTGAKILIVVTLGEKVNGSSCKDPAVYPESTSRQPIDVYHRLESGAWEKLFTLTTGADVQVGKVGWCAANRLYTLMGVGNHSFYAEFKGNDYLQGCGKEAKTFAR